MNENRRNSARPLSSSASALSSLEPEIVPLPFGLSMERMGQVLRLRRRWWGRRALVLGAFAIVWNAVVFPKIAAGALPAFFVITHGGTALAVTYAALAYLLNRSTIEIGSGLLTVRHGPFPAARNRELAVVELAQLSVAERVVEHKNGQPHYFYDLVAELKDGARVELMKNLGNGLQARTIEQAIEEHLGIVDREEKDT